jgi:hypothetical protein
MKLILVRAVTKADRERSYRMVQVFGRACGLESLHPC